MSDKEKQNEKAVPFFARFLEGQNVAEMSEEESEAIGGGMIDEDPNSEIVTTLKYPSDDEDGGIGVTEKYPSDAEDNPRFRRRWRRIRWLWWRRRRGDDE